MAQTQLHRQFQTRLACRLPCSLLPLQAFLDAFRRHMSPEDRPGPSPVSLSLPPSRCGPQALAMTACALARMRYRPALGWMVRFTEVRGLRKGEGVWAWTWEGVWDEPFGRASGVGY